MKIRELNPTEIEARAHFGLFQLWREHLIAHAKGDPVPPSCVPVTAHQLARAAGIAFRIASDLLYRTDWLPIGWMVTYPLATDGAPCFGPVIR